MFVCSHVIGMGTHVRVCMWRSELGVGCLPQMMPSTFCIKAEFFCKPQRSTESTRRHILESQKGCFISQASAWVLTTEPSPNPMYSNIGYIL